MQTQVTIEITKDVHQDSVTVLSLERTLTDSFSTASNLYRNFGKRSKSVGDENGERHRRPLRKRRDSSSDSDSHHRLRRLRSRSRRREGDSNSDEELEHFSVASIRAEYDHGYGRFGEKFAVGDLLAQNQLQAQIIAMQQAIISVYQSGNGEHSRRHLANLVQSAHAARAASKKVLADLFFRMIAEAETPRIPGAFPLSSSSTNELVIRARSKSRSRTKRQDDASILSDRSDTLRRLFCPYAIDLQRHLDQPLAHSYLEGGDGRCPYCRTDLHTRPRKAWELVLEDGRRNSGKAFLIGNRFVVKSHRETGGFACVLCNRFSNHDTVCSEIAELLDHVWKEHKAEELEADKDVRQI